jgi:hypothetical protein
VRVSATGGLVVMAGAFVGLLLLPVDFPSGTSLSIGVFFSLMTIGLAADLPGTLSAGLRAQGCLKASRGGWPACHRSRPSSPPSSGRTLHGLTIVFATAAGMALIAAGASLPGASPSHGLPIHRSPSTCLRPPTRRVPPSGGELTFSQLPLRRSGTSG